MFNTIQFIQIYFSGLVSKYFIIVVNSYKISDGGSARYKYVLNGYTLA